MNPKKVGREPESVAKMLSITEHPEFINLYTQIENVRKIPELRTLYTQIENLKNSPVWGICHIYTGFCKEGTPYVKRYDKSIRMADFYGFILGVQTAKKQCATHGCFNPYHYQAQAPAQIEQVEVLNPDSGVDELIEYVLNSNTVPRFMWTFETLRPYFDVQEVTDAQLKQYLKQYLENLPSEN